MKGLLTTILVAFFLARPLIAAIPSCYVTTNCIGDPINSTIAFAECCANLGASYNFDGRCQPCPSSKLNATEAPNPSPVKYCIGTGDFSLSGEGSYTVNVRYGYISCFGVTFSYNDSYAIASGPFFCEGNSSFVLNGYGLLYTVTSDDYNNCTNLIDSISFISGNASVLTSCIGSETYAFLGNGIFTVVVNTSLPNNGLTCLGTTNEILFSNGTAFTQTFGPFSCISSGYLMINGTGVIEDDDIYCAVTPITRTGEPLECSGTGEFEIIGSGFFGLVAIPEITCVGTGEYFAYDIGTIFISRGNFACNGSEFFNLNGTGEIESVTTVRGSHNCTDNTGMPDGSGVIDVVTCTGEGDYVIVGDGNFYINQSGPEMLQCSGEVIFVQNTSQKAEYITNGEFSCQVSGIVYFTGIGRAEIINASAPYECNGVFFPSPTVEPPFSGFGSDEVNCFTCGDYFIVGAGQIEIVAQLPSSLNCQGAVSSYLNQSVAQNVFVTTGDFFCTGNGFAHMTGRGDVLVNSTVFNNCTHDDTVTSDGLLFCSHFDAVEILEVSVYPRMTSNVVEEENVTLRCVGVGHPPPLVQWRKLNGSLSDRASITNMSMSTNERNVTRVTVGLILTSVSREDTGDYECLASNILNNTTRNISLIVQFIPSVVIPPVDEIRDQAENVTFLCQAVGEPVPDISWYFNGVMINVSDNSSKYMIMSRSLNITTTENTLTVYNVTSSDVGTYTCNSSNIIGSVHVTSSGILTVTSIATVSQINDEVLLERNATTIICEAIGYPPPTVQWDRTDGTLSDRVSVSGSISVPTGYGSVTRVSVNLTITNASREDTGVYMCSANNSVGDDIINASITVQFQTEIIDEVTDLLENETFPSTFTCEATGEPVPNISWYFNDSTLLVSDTSKYNISNSLNDTVIKSLLTIVSAQSSDVGKYTCHAENIIGTDRSSGILTVNNAAEILEPLREIQYVQEGENITLECTGVGHPPPLVQWRKLNGTLSDRISITNVSVSTNEGNVTRVTVDLTLSGAYREDTTNYMCLVSNLLNRVTRNVSLIVQFAPSIPILINNEIRNQSQNVTFLCQAVGEPVPDISWYFNGVIVNVSDNSSKYMIMSRSLNITTTENTLTVYNVTSSDVGTYTCNATNIVGNDSTSGHLQVNVPPKIDAFYASEIFVPENDNITINCSATGYPPPSLQWTRNGVKLTDERFTINDIPCSLDCFARVTSSLMITNASRSDIAMYTCTAMNILGEVNASLNLTVQYHVNIVQNKSGGDVINNSIVNAFNNPERSVVLDCVTVRGHEIAVWEVQPSPEIFDGIEIATHSIYLSTIKIVDDGVINLISLKCVSNTSKEYRTVNITTENPYLRLLSDTFVNSSAGSRPTLMYVIAVDADGVREQQQSLNSIASFEFVNKNGQSFNYSSNFTEFMETSFQHYSYTLPALEEDDEGNYTLTLMNSEKKTARNIVSIEVESIEDVGIHTPYNGITILQGDDVTLSCTPSVSDIALQWSYNDDDISSSPNHHFAPPFLNHNLTIANANDIDSGNYVCAFKLKSRVIAQRNINLIVVPTCLQDFSGGLLWPTSRRNREVTHRCSTLHLSLRPGVTISRKCNDDGTWGPVDDSSCTALNNAIPILIVSFAVNVSQSNAEDIAHNITQLIKSRSDAVILSNDSVLYDLRQAGNTGVFIRFTSNSFAENSTLPQILPGDIPNNTLLYSNEIKLFIPGLKCKCSLSEEPVRTICIGPSIPPCDCSQTRCECNSPFIGNDGFCGLDTDSDGCPDVDLGCSQSNCFKDLCVNDYTESPLCNSDESICNPPPLLPLDMIDTTICLRETDVDWNITWPTTDSGQTVRQKCPGGAESIGLASRLCDGSPAVWQNPNVENCSTVEITRIQEEVQNLMIIFDANRNSNNSDRTIMVEPEVLQSITGELASVTDKNETTLLPNDLGNTLGTMETILSIGESDPATISDDTLMNLVDITDNLYNPQNEAAYNALDDKEEGEEAPVGSQALQNVVMLANLISLTLETDGDESTSFSQSGESVSIEAQLLSKADIERGVNVTFPMQNNNISVQSEVPSSTIKMFPGPVTNTFLANSFLPSDFDGPGEYNISSPVLVVQINTTGPVQLPENGTVSMTFKIPENRTNFTNLMKCVFWEPEKNSWSDTGVTTIKVGNTVECQAEHLTSFAVLVDVQGNKGSTSVGSALSTVSYIGCGISIFSLLLTMFAIVYWRKSIYKGIQNFIHFNLCLSLMIGLIAFVSAVENAKDSEIGCTVVAVLMHYFFLAAFVWMLCEGIFLFLFLNFVFYNGFFTKWYFYLGLGWGLPVPIVAIAAGIANEHYGSENGCWLSEVKGTIWAFIAPMLLIIAINSIVLIISLRVIYKSKRRTSSPVDASRTELAKTVFISAATLMPILGSTWVIGLFAINEQVDAFAWIFTILNSLQGFFIFFFYVLKQEKVRKKFKESEHLRRFTGTLLASLPRKTSSSYYSDTIKGTDSQISKSGKANRFRSYSLNLQTTSESKENTTQTVMSPTKLVMSPTKSKSASVISPTRSLTSPIKEIGFRIESSAVVENEYYLWPDIANPEFETTFNNLQNLDAVNEENLNNTATVICNVDNNNV